MSGKSSNSLLDSGSSNISKDKEGSLAEACCTSEDYPFSLNESVELLSSGQAYPPLSLDQSLSPPLLTYDQFQSLKSEYHEFLPHLDFCPIDTPQTLSPRFEDQAVPHQRCDSGYASLDHSPPQGSDLDMTNMRISTCRPVNLEDLSSVWDQNHVSNTLREHDLVPLFEGRRRANLVAEKAEDHSSEFLPKREHSDQDDRTSTEVGHCKSEI